MTFKLDENTFMISGFRGDSASFTFSINTDTQNYSLCFFIKKNINDAEEKALITKVFENPENNVVQMDLSSEDTNKLPAKNGCFQDYYWSLKLKQNNSVHTLIPLNFGDLPIFRVYP